MDSSRFDALARRLGGRISRRDAVKGMVAGAVAMTAGAAVLAGEADAVCGREGVRCNRDAACCSGRCYWSTVTRGRRKARVGACSCQIDGGACSDDSSCCSGTCYAGTCLWTCREYTGSSNEVWCDSDNDCCYGDCGEDRQCKQPAGTLCGADANCQSGICTNGKCKNCLADQSPCGRDLECCSGWCYAGACSST